MNPINPVANAASTALENPSKSEGLISSVLDSNPYFSAGFGLMAVGVALTGLRKTALHGLSFAQRRMLVTLEISSKDPSYLWFLKWMSEQSNKQKLLLANKQAPRNLMERISLNVKSHELAVETRHEQRSDGTSATEFSLIPGPGTHYFQYNNAWFQVKRERATNMIDLNSGTPWETVTLTALSRDRTLFSNLLTEARQLAQQSQVGYTVIYTAWGAEWRPFGKPRLRRILDSVVLENGLKEELLRDINQFTTRGKWYLDRGIPYRRGYLFHGPPGSGKSSLIQALAGTLGYNICTLNLAERGLTDDKLNHLLANAPERSVIVLEDIDAAFSGRDQTSEQGFKSNVTFSGLLNALDGIASSSAQRILFMTTNHIEKLDPALIRPGRVDMKLLIDDAKPSQAAALFRRFYTGSVDEQTLESLASKLQRDIEAELREELRISMALLQGHFIRYSNAQSALDNWQELKSLAREDYRTKMRFASSP